MSKMTLAECAARIWRTRLAIGVLGIASLAACDDEPTTAPATATGSSATAQRVKSEPRDVSPHREGHVTTKSATLHFLDWGGKGPTLVLLPGLGDNAHIYDDLAPKLSEYHVIAITRRGYGQSSRPTTGYEVDTLVNDVIAVLDHLHLDRVYLAGHSIAGNELTRLSVRYPERVERVVYLDAAADRSADFSARSSAAVVLEDVMNEPPPSAADLESFGTFVSYQKRISSGPWTPARTNNLWHAVIVDRNDGHVVSLSTSDAIAETMFMKSLQYHAEFSSLKMPAHAIGALPGTIFDQMPWLSPTVSGDSLMYAEFFLGAVRAQIQFNLAAFAAQAPFATTQFIDNTNHYLFVANESDIIAALRGFLPSTLSRR